jgi:hypothetical protein
MYEALRFFTLISFKLLKLYLLRPFVYCYLRRPLGAKL